MCTGRKEGRDKRGERLRESNIHLNPLSPARFVPLFSDNSSERWVPAGFRWRPLPRLLFRGGLQGGRQPIEAVVGPVFSGSMSTPLRASGMDTSPHVLGLERKSASTFAFPGTCSVRTSSTANSSRQLAPMKLSPGLVDFADSFCVSARAVMESLCTASWSVMPLIFSLHLLIATRIARTSKTPWDADDLYSTKRASVCFCSIALSFKVKPMMKPETSFVRYHQSTAIHLILVLGLRNLVTVLMMRHAVGGRSSIKPYLTVDLFPHAQIDAPMFCMTVLPRQRPINHLAVSILNR